MNPLLLIIFLISFSSISLTIENLNSNNVCNSIQPQSSSICLNGSWVDFNNTIGDGITLIINNTVIQTGSLYIAPNGILELEGLNSQLIIENCAVILGLVKLNLSENDMVEIKTNSKQNVFKFNLFQSSCPSITQIIPKLNYPSNCIDFTSSFTNYEFINSTYYMIYSNISINPKKCNIWWILLLSFLGFLLFSIAIMFAIKYFLFGKIRS